MLLPILPIDQIDHIFATINDIHTLILHTEGTINQAHNHVALRAVNLAIHQSTSDQEYTMARDIFKETVSQHTALQKSLKEARFSIGDRFRHTNHNQTSTSGPSYSSFF